MTTWTPLLPEPLRARALEASAAIVDELVTTAPDVGDAWAAAQRALTLVEYGRLTGDPSRDGDAEVLAERAAALTATTTLSRRFIKGVVGVAWILETICEDDGDADEDDDDTDQAIAGCLELPPRPLAAYLDLVSGLVGCGVYFLARPDTPANRHTLEEIVYRLEETAEYLDDGIAWWGRTVLGPGREVDGFNLGLAHGVPGIVAFLARALQRGVSPERTFMLLDGAVRWMLRQQLEGGPSCYPMMCTREGNDGPSRSAWCYGDPGVALALFAAASAADDAGWRDAALDLARTAAVRPMSTCHVVDAGVCHGAAGLLHVFNRLYQATGDPDLARGALRWFEPILSLLSDGYWDGVPGADEPASLKVSSVLTGKAGIALSLLSAASSVEPRWDGMLLADVAASRCAGVAR